MVLLGGMGTVFGPIFGAVAFLVLDEVVWRNFLQLHTGVLGLLIVVLILFLPSALSSIGLHRLWRKGGLPHDRSARTQECQPLLRWHPRHSRTCR